MQITDLTLNSIRCFAGEQRVRLAPLTLLVGENSTGKSTVLGCYHALINGAGVLRPFESMHFLVSPSVDFNIPPYQMGSVRNIARGRSGSFSLGMHFQFSPSLGRVGNTCMETHLDFALAKVRFYLRSIRYIMPGAAAVTFHYSADDVWCVSKVTVHPQDGEPYYVDVAETKLMEYMFHRLSGTPMPVPKDLPSDFSWDAFSHLMSEFAEELNRLAYTFSIAPVRAKPRRVYEPMYSHSDPEGGEIPMELMELKLTNPDLYEKIRAELNQFGKASGLFDDISIKRSTGAGMPFSLQAKVRRRKVNLVDVGYGVSQILPTLVNMFADEKGATFLLQQPEVHLHPQAQAAFASLMVSAIAQKGQRFIVETHTDYLVDRARIEIRRGNIAPEDVSIAYFAPKNGGVTIHNIGFDEKGKLADVPKGYRDFFLQEGDRLLGFAA